MVRAICERTVYGAVVYIHICTLYMFCCVINIPASTFPSGQLYIFHFIHGYLLGAAANERTQHMLLLLVCICNIYSYICFVPIEYVSNMVLGVLCAISAMRKTHIYTLGIISVVRWFRRCRPSKTLTQSRLLVRVFLLFCVWPQLLLIPHFCLLLSFANILYMNISL